MSFYTILRTKEARYSTQGYENGDFRIATSNCKNIETTKHGIGVLYKKPDVLLIQENWYFDCQLNKLCDDNKLMTGKGKEVDTNYPFLSSSDAKRL